MRTSFAKARKLSAACANHLHASAKLVYATLPARCGSSLSFNADSGRVFYQKNSEIMGIAQIGVSIFAQHACGRVWAEADFQSFSTECQMRDLLFGK
jgi:hypothetical protein